MTDDALEQLLEQSVRRDPSSVVMHDVVATWSAVFGGDWAECDGDVVPTVMYPTFARPSAPPAPGDEAPTGVVLHDELKMLLSLPVAIAVGYELELTGGLRISDQLISTERISALGPERPTKFGPGRDWVIEVSSSTTMGKPLGVERYRMLGYRPGRSGDAPHPRSSDSGLRMWTWAETVDVSVETIRACAAANHVWAPAHHHPDAAQEAGLPDIILDTSSQVAMMAGAAQRRRPHDRVIGVDLAMKRPILPGATLTLSGSDNDSKVTVSASVDGREVSRATIIFGK